ncbi:hypothetical protein ACFY05_32165 [Microtetraspora fusca]|uniref:HNH endonuclease n=1 Tax=Microtetraspora fusca TaxID=1997 RepID=A0ABW6VDZ1_MICFU
MFTLDELDRLLTDPVDRRFFAKLAYGEVPAHQSDLGRCIIWTRATNKDGYGAFKDGDGKTVNSHLWLYRRLVGPLPEGYELDHLCHRRDVCTPGPTCPHRVCVIHVDPVTQLENWRRSGAITVIHANQEMCEGYKGTYHHPLSGDNLYITPDGRRECRACHRMRCEDYRARRKMLLSKLRDAELRAAGQLTLIDL